MLRGDLVGGMSPLDGLLLPALLRLIGPRLRGALELGSTLGPIPINDVAEVVAAPSAVYQFPVCRERGSDILT